MPAVLYFPGTEPPSVPSMAPHELVDADADLDFPGGLFRVHRWAYGITVTDLDGAGKRGARIGSFFVDTDRTWGRPDDWLTRLCQWVASIPLAASYADVLEAAADLAIHGDKHTHRGVDVRPLGLPVLAVSGPLCGAHVDYREASAADYTDRHNEPRAMLRSPSPQACKVARRVLADLAPGIEAGTVGFHDLTRAWCDAGLSVHSWCGMD